MTEKSVGRELTPASVPAGIWNEFERQRYGEAGDHSLRLEWSESCDADYDYLTRLLLWELICRASVKNGRLSIRALSRAIGVPKSTLPARLRGLIDAGIVSVEDLRKKIDHSFETTES